MELQNCLKEDELFHFLKGKKRKRRENMKKKRKGRKKKRHTDLKSYDFFSEMGILQI